jgi:H+/Cl- antiporter ClcA
MFFQVVIFSTLGMMSGLSLGPEMPLVLASSMVGSKIALMTKQSVLSARVINLTACAAAIGGFFGFPMAGALFVLELPHRMGLQYFEALSPAVISSIISSCVYFAVSTCQRFIYYQCLGMRSKVIMTIVSCLSFFGYFRHACQTQSNIFFIVSFFAKKPPE